MKRRPTVRNARGRRAASNLPAYKNPAVAPEKRIKDLLARMTLEEKAAQMMCVWQAKKDKLVDAEGNFDLAKAKVAFRKGHGLGQIGRPSDAGAPPAEPWLGRTARQMAELTNAIQKFFLENSRLGIPVVFHEECLHGHAARDATSFPQPIGLGATFNPALVEQLFTMTAYEARVRGTHQALTPVVDVARDPRWGRVEETYGEDPLLNARLGVAAVRGFQGDATFKDKRRVMATLKHFAAHGQPESGQNCAPVNVSERVLRETFLHPLAPGRVGPEGRAPGKAARCARGADVVLEIPVGPVRRSLRGSRRGGPRRGLRRASRTGTLGRTRNHHAAQERNQPRPARSGEA
jgi:beta-glucosidase